MSARKCCVGLALVLALAGLPAGATVPPPGDAAEISRAEAYLNAVTTLKARFMQVAPSGDVAEGTAYISRPGRMRLDYDPPSPILVVADGKVLYYFDKKLQQTSYFDLDSTPAGVLIKPEVKLDGEDLKVTKVAHQPGVVDITVARRSDPGQGRITLVFTESPFQLRQWQVVDPQGQTTTVSLFDAQTGLAFNKDLFVFSDPRATGLPDLSPSRP
jgi:outer membrane lipoprotein-sorting protein